MDDDWAIAQLDYLLSFRQGLGLYGIFSTYLPITPPQKSPRNDDDTVECRQGEDIHLITSPATTILSPALLYCMLSIALELRPQSPFFSEQGSLEPTVDSLRAGSLAYIPHLSWQYEPNVSHALSLLFFSSTWCFTSDFIDVSMRWNTLAQVIIDDAIQSHACRTDNVGDMERQYD